MGNTALKRFLRLTQRLRIGGLDCGEAACVFIPSEARAEVLWKPHAVSFFVRSGASAPLLGTER